LADPQRRCPECGRTLLFTGELCEDCRLRRFTNAATEAGFPTDTGEEPGRIGRYRLIRLLGRGGTGSVWEAFDDTLRRRLAIKLVTEFDSLPARLQERFDREAWIAGRLDHPHIVRVFDAGRSGKAAFIAMELVEGGTLHANIQIWRASRVEGSNESAPHDDEWLRDLCAKFVGVASALEYCRKLSVLHRDIKPLNILISATDGRFLLSDFGLAKDAGLSPVTVKGDFIGTLPYMAPEQLMAQRATVDHRSDLWSLGVTLYEALTLTLPFDADSEERYVTALATQDPVSPRRRRASLPKDLDTVVLKCLRRDPRDRYASAGDLAEDLQRVLDRRPVLARRMGWPERLVRSVRRHRSAWLGIGAAAVLASVAADFLVQGEKSSAQRRVTMAWLTELKRSDGEGEFPRVPPRSERDSMLRGLLPLTNVKDEATRAALLDANLGIGWSVPDFDEFGRQTKLELRYVPDRLELSGNDPHLVQFFGRLDDGVWRPLAWVAAESSQSGVLLSYGAPLDRLSAGRVEPAPHRVAVRARIDWFAPGGPRSQRLRGQAQREGFGLPDSKLGPITAADRVRSEWRDLGSRQISIYRSYDRSFPRAAPVLTRGLLAPTITLRRLVLTVAALPQGSGRRVCLHIASVSWGDSAAQIGIPKSDGRISVRGDWIMAAKLEGWIGQADQVPLALRARVRLGKDPSPVIDLPLIVTSSGLQAAEGTEGAGSSSGMLSQPETRNGHDGVAAFVYIGLLAPAHSALRSGTFQGDMELVSDRALAAANHLETFAAGPAVRQPIEVEVVSRPAKWCDEDH